MGIEIRSLIIGLLAAAVILTALILGVPGAPSPSPVETSRIEVAPAVKPKPKIETPPFVMPACGAPTGTTPEKGDPKARGAAQKGLAFLSRETRAWQKQHGCYGCHVHAVTLEAMVVGIHNQYDLSRGELAEIVTGMKTLRGGVRHTVQGFSYDGSTLLAPSKAFGGAAFAHYDEWVGPELRDDLVKTAEQLLAFQQADGSIELSWTNPPVGAGVIQGTYQAAQTWRQVYARTADEKWLIPLQKAERYITSQATQWQQSPPSDIQQINYALLGLTQAGMGNGEALILALEKQLLSLRRDDGGWSLSGGAADAFATGQTLYTLRTLGRSDGDPIVAAGTKWLIDHQLSDGGWSHTGFGKAEAMWGVLGLVSVDVLSVTVKGVTDGQHAKGTLTMSAEAKDNQGGGVSKLEIKIDDVLVYGACGATLSYAWNTDGLDDGKHLIDVIATNAKGLTSRRRIEVYTGAYYLTQIGVSATGTGADISMRDIAPTELGGNVTMEIVDGTGKVVATMAQPSAAGANTLSWSGKATNGDVAPKGKYTARLSRSDGRGNRVQSADVPFVHDTQESQTQNYGAFSGQLKSNGAGMANTEIELVDQLGKVVGKTRSTDAGEYRFKGVDAGKYKLRIQKKGYQPVEREVDAAKAEDKKNDIDLK